MQLSPARPRTATTSSKSNFDRLARTEGSEHAFGEIGAYIAIRDRLLENAESSRTEVMLDRAEQANEFLQSCLKPARTPYQAQSLPEADAARERTRCEAVQVRIERLRATLADAA
jgi:hypothetical protein